jgi:stearoyl-CoA desaturase (delta-9 desaturase)
MKAIAKAMDEGISYTHLGFVLAFFLYLSGLFVVTTWSWWLTPLGHILSTLGFVQLYRVGFSCTSLREKQVFRSNVMRRVLGQVSLLLLLRPIISLRTERDEVSNGKRLLGSTRLCWVCGKVRKAYSVQQQLLYAKMHPELSKHAHPWVWLQLSSVLVFAGLYFSSIVRYHGLSGVVRFWLIPFAAMHFHVGSFNFGVSKQQTRANADKIFRPFGTVKQAKQAKQQATSEAESKAPAAKKEQPLHWFNIIYLGLAHVGAAYGIYVAGSSSYTCYAMAVSFFVLSELGITGGAHRLWAHRAYSANNVVQVFLMLCCCMANEGSILKWSRDHRLHHKHVDTEMDPHDATRGFWYSHVGWLVWRKDSSVITAGRQVHMADLEENKIVAFQHRNYLWLSLLLCFVLPTLLAPKFGVSAWEGFWVVGVLRYICVLHGTWFVNSLAHLWGTRPYLPNILPCDNLIVSIFAMGEGWHNYHHAYPYDYSANEYGWWQWNPTTLFLDLCAMVGAVYDRRKAKPNKGVAVPDSELPRFSMEDVKASANQAAMLLVIDGYVYDVASFVDEKLHPGGEGILKAYVGKDASDVFRSGKKHAHTEVAYNLLKTYKIGVLKA